MVPEHEERQSEPQSQSESQSQSATPTKKRHNVPLSPGKVTGCVAEMPGILIYTFLQTWADKDNGEKLPKENYVMHRKQN